MKKEHPIVLAIANCAREDNSNEVTDERHRARACWQLSAFGPQWSQAMLDIGYADRSEVAAVETFEVVPRCDPHCAALHAITTKRPVMKRPPCRIANRWRSVGNQ